MRILCTVLAMTTCILAFGQTVPRDVSTSSYSPTLVEAGNKITIGPGFYVPSGSNFQGRIREDLYISGVTSTKNYVKTEVAYTDDLTTSTFPSATPAQKTVDVQYFDGLGRPQQSVNVKAAPGYKDLVTPFEYDAFGRNAKAYLPYAASPGDGDFKTSATTAQGSFYSTSLGTYSNKIATDANPYALKIYEPSPLNRLLQQGAPGTAWQPDAGSPSTAHAAESNYKVNVDGTSSDGQEAIYIWTVSSGIDQAYAVTSNSDKYPSNTLQIVETRDEDKRRVRTYYDNRGLMILKKVQAVASPQTHVEGDWAYTYYVYDIFDRLRFVLPPEFYTRFSTEYLGQSSGAQASLLNAWAYQYSFDSRGRMICKNLPGAERVDMVYDEWDRLVLTQDGVQRAAGTKRWSFIKYDIYDRVIITGEYASSNDRATMATAVAAITVRNETSSSGDIGYTTNATYPTSISISNINSIVYYDDYSFKTLLTLGSNYDCNITFSSRVRSKPTGSKIRVLGSSDWLIAATYYDERSRVIQTMSSDQLTNKNRVTNSYVGITPRVVGSTTVHGASLMTKLDETDYDHRGRILKAYVTMDGGSSIITNALKYNEIGELVDKSVHSTNSGASYLQSVDYRYNIRGWNTHINNSSIANDGSTNDDSNDLFGMELKYNQVIAINGTNTTGQYNGNVSSIQWSTNNLRDPVVEKIYGFAYDPMSRLKDATYAKKSGGTFSGDVNLYNENITYDKNGNIATLDRKGLLGVANVQIDQLSYSYTNGNQLAYVTDNSSYYDFYKANPAYGFIEYTHASTSEYTYDENGSMTSDLNKQIESITYNVLNLPVLITFDNDNKIEYTWSAAGTKLKKTVKVGSTTVSTTHYVGGIQYENSTLKFVLTSDGRIVKTDSGWDHEYHLKDHLGNTRVAYGVTKIANTYTATMEEATASQEGQDFQNVGETRDSQQNHTSTSSLYPTPNQSSLANPSHPVGPAKMLAVKENDAVTITAYAKFVTGKGNDHTLISNLASTILGTYGLVNAGETVNAYTALNSAIPIYSGTVDNSSSTVPKAYLAYILFNSSHESPQFGFDQITTSASGAWETLNITISDMPNDGYLYVYVVNESNVTGVFFDDVSIAHTRTDAGLLVTQTNDYYPFGLAISPTSYQNQATNRNDYKYNGKEIQDEFGLNWMDYGARMYQADIGRWGGVDLLADKFTSWSPYSFAYNSPIRFIDLFGMANEDVVRNDGIRPSDFWYDPVNDQFNVTKYWYDTGPGDDTATGLLQSNGEVWPNFVKVDLRKENAGERLIDNLRLAFQTYRKYKKTEHRVLLEDIVDTNTAFYESGSDIFDANIGQKGNILSGHRIIRGQAVEIIIAWNVSMHAGTGDHEHEYKTQIVSMVDGPEHVDGYDSDIKGSTQIYRIKIDDGITFLAKFKLESAEQAQRIWNNMLAIQRYINGK